MSSSAAFDVSISSSGSADAAVSLSLAAEAGAPLVKVAHPLFASLPCSFDLQDGPETRRFTVRARDPISCESVAPAPVIGGSTGRILFVIRDNGLTVPDADADQARALVDALTVQGFDARLTSLGGAGRRRRLGPSFRTPPRASVRARSRRSRTSEFARGGDAAFRRLRERSVVGVVGNSHDAHRRSRRPSTAIDRERTGAAPAVRERRDSSAGSPLRSCARSRMLARGARAFFATGEEETECARFWLSGARAWSRAFPAGRPSRTIGACAEWMNMSWCTADRTRGNQFLAIRAASARVFRASSWDGRRGRLLLRPSRGRRRPAVLPEEALSAGQIEALYAGARVYADLRGQGTGPHASCAPPRTGRCRSSQPRCPQQLWPD